MSKDATLPLNLKKKKVTALWRFLSLLNALNILHTKLVDICLSRYFSFLKIIFTFENG